MAASSTINVTSISREIFAEDVVNFGGEDHTLRLDMKRAIRLFQVTGHFVVTASTSISMIISPDNFYKFLSVLTDGGNRYTEEDLLLIVSPSEFIELGAKIYLLIQAFAPTDDQVRKVNSMLKSSDGNDPVPNEKPPSKQSEGSGGPQWEDSDLLPNPSGL